MSLTKVTYSMIEGISVNVDDFGATGDGVTDDTAAIQAAIDSLPSANAYGALSFTNGKRYLITDTEGSVGQYALLFDKSMIVYGNGAILVYNGSARAIRLVENDCRIYDLNVRNSNYSLSGATGDLEGTGWSIYNCYDNKFYNCTAEGYQYGFSFYGSGEGSSYHELYSCIAKNNQYNAFFGNDSVAGSYCTNINWFGGRAQVQSVFSGGYTGSKGILINASTVGSGNSVDGIHFYGTTVEGYADVKVQCGADWCSFTNLYYDIHGPTATNDIVIESTASYTNISGGDALNFQVIDNLGSYTGIFDGSEVQTNGVISTGGLDISGGSGSSSGQIKFPAIQRPSTDANTLDDYEENFAWSPTVDQLVNFTGTPTISNGYYTKVGNLVHVQGILTGTVTAGSADTSCRLTLPFSQKDNADGATGTAISDLSGVIGYTSDFSSGVSGTMQIRFPAASAISSGACSIRFALTYCASQ